MTHPLIQHLASYTLASESDCRLTLASVIAGYPVLLEGLPGVGKTGLALGVAQALALDFKRLQCTPDTQPADITGYLRPDPGGQNFVFVEGPVFTPCLLVDEINRANPRSQAALLEAMAEGTVSVEGQTHSLPPERVILATQNPQDQIGTQALPESQLDRFGVVLTLGYPDAEKESAVIARQLDTPPAAPALDLLDTRASVRGVVTNDQALGYLTRLIQATRSATDFRHGLSTRGALVLADLARALAFLDRRDFVAPDDVQQAFLPVARHRLTLNTPGAAALTPDSRLMEVIQGIAL
ncbi:MAG: AAA family ATPase [Litorivicinus sp.]